jgi:hypothetical protein
MAVASARRKKERTARRNAAIAADPGIPTKQRLELGDIERVDRIVDDEGRAAAPYRARTSLAQLFTRAIIDRDMFEAGQGFNLVQGRLPRPAARERSGTWSYSCERRRNHDQLAWISHTGWRD